MADRPMGVYADDSSLAFTWGIAPGKWLDEVGGKVLEWISRGLIEAKKLVKNMINGAKAIGESIIKGNFLDILKNVIKEEPGAAVAGAVAVVLIAGVAVGVVAAGVGAVAGLIASAGVGGAVTTGAVMAFLAPKAVQLAQTIYNFDFAKSDNALMQEVESAFGSLANIAGESTGKALAGLLIGKGKQPQLQINMRATATLWLILEEQGKTEIHEEMLEALASLGWAMIRYARQVALTMGYIQVRKWARQNLRTGIGWLDKNIEQWGLAEGQSWKISQKVETFVEQVQETDKALGNFLEGFLEGFGEGITEFLVLEYAR